VQETAVEGLLHNRANPVIANAALIFAVLQNSAESLLDNCFVNLCDAKST
jgi:hypothetical protein